MNKKLSNRTKARIEAVNILYEALLTGINIKELLTSDRFKNIDKFTLELVNGVDDNYSMLVELIESALTKYHFDRLNVIDQAINLVACYELSLKNLPKEIIINEALVISGIYTKTESDDTVRFNNRLLDNVSKKLGL